MVFLTLPIFARNRGPCEFWRKRKIFKLAAHFETRRRNCYSLTIRGVHKALMACTIGRKLKKEDMKQLWETRVDAASREHGLSSVMLLEGLTRCNILLNRKTLSDLAIWEPRTFKALVDFACARTKQDGLKLVANTKMPESVILRELIK